MKANIPTDEQVRQRAYGIFVRNGSHPGHEVDNWLQAEYELMQLPIRKIAEMEPTQRKRSGKILVVSLVQAAVLLGTEALLKLKR